MVATIRSVVDGNLAQAAESALETLRLLEAWSVPEVANYRTTMAIMLGRERRTLGTLLRLAAAMEGLGSSSAPTRALAAFIRFESGDMESPPLALNLVRVDEFADAGHAVVVALWTEMAAVLGTDEQRHSFAAILEPQAGVHMLAGGIFFRAADRLRAAPRRPRRA